MRLVTMLAEQEERIGVVQGDRVAELDTLPDGVKDLKGLLQAVTPERLASLDPSLSAIWPLDEVQLRPPIPDPAKIICVGVNYRAHRDEAGRPEIEHPTLFTRFADTQIAHEQAAIRPRVSERFDYEGELAVVIGARAHRVEADDALRYVAGLSVYNDFSVRDWQRHSTQWIPGKNFPQTGSFGPALVTLDELPELSSLSLTTKVNGEVRQQASLADLIFDVPALIAYISSFTVLSPGDVIVTGTPGGVGQFMDPPAFLREGDAVEVEITGVGVLRNVVALEA